MLHSDLVSFARCAPQKEFPYDAQAAQFFLESSVWDVRAVEFLAATSDLATTMLPDGFSVIEWDLKGTLIQQGVFVYDGLGGSAFSRFTIKLNLKRQPEYYLTKIVTVAMSVEAQARTPQHRLLRVAGAASPLHSPRYRKALRSSPSQGTSTSTPSSWVCLSLTWLVASSVLLLLFIAAICVSVWLW